MQGQREEFLQKIVEEHKKDQIVTEKREQEISLGREQEEARKFARYIKKTVSNGYQKLDSLLEYGHETPKRARAIRKERDSFLKEQKEPLIAMIKKLGLEKEIIDDRENVIDMARKLDMQFMPQIEKEARAGIYEQIQEQISEKESSIGKLQNEIIQLKMQVKRLEARDATEVEEGKKKGIRIGKWTYFK